MDLGPVRSAQRRGALLELEPTLGRRTGPVDPANHRARAGRAGENLLGMGEWRWFGRKSGTTTAGGPRPPSATARKARRPATSAPKAKPLVSAAD